MPIFYNNEIKYLPIVVKYAKEKGIPPALILAHIKQESKFDPKAFRQEPPPVNDASIGLMQVLIGTAKSIDSSATKKKLEDPDFNIQIGSSYIAKNLAKYKDLNDAIASYNGGSPRRDILGRYVNSKGIPNVQDYVDKVYKNYINYDKWLRSGAKAVEVSLFDPILIIVGGVLIYMFMRKKYGSSNRLSER